MAPKNAKETVESIKKYVAETPVEIEIIPEIKDKEEVEQIK